MEFAAIVAGVSAIIKAAPMVVDVVLKVKDLIATLFARGIISKQQQDALSDHVDSVVAAFQAGEVPPEFTVEPDPTEPGSPTP